MGEHRPPQQAHHEHGGEDGGEHHPEPPEQLVAGGGAPAHLEDRAVRQAERRHLEHRAARGPGQAAPAPLPRGQVALEP